MTEIKKVILSMRSLDREIARLKEEIEMRRRELLQIAPQGERVKTSAPTSSVQERVYFALERLYVQLCDLLRRQCDARDEFECAIQMLDPTEQEIARAWAAGRTEEQIGRQVGYSRATIARQKKRILIKLDTL